MVYSGCYRTVGEENFDKLVNSGKGAALMTGTIMEMEPFAAAWPSLGNKTIAEAIQKNIEDGRNAAMDR